MTILNGARPESAELPSDPRDLLTGQQWCEPDRTTDRALPWLATSQSNGGSFRTHRGSARRDRPSVLAFSPPYQFLLIFER